MENPYEAPSFTPIATDQLRRPVGVAILSILTGLLGLTLLAAYVILLMNWRENNEFAISRRLAPSVFWFFPALTLALAFAASIGMWRGRKWGWWIACCGLVLFVVQNLGSAVMANLSQGAPSFATFLSVDSLKYVTRGVICVGILAYWSCTRVRQYFNVEKTGRTKAIVLSALWGIGITTVITVVLQSIFLFRTR